MDTNPKPITADALAERLWRPGAPLVVDARRDADFQEFPRLVPGAIRRAVDRHPAPPAGPKEVVVVCAHGRSISQGLCRQASESGITAAYLEGGMTAWRERGLPTLLWKAPLAETPSQWITRERPKIDRIACPWLIRRFVDPLAQFHYVPTALVREEARRRQAEPYDVPDVAFSHDGERCSFDAFLRHFDLQAPGLERLATIVRGADTGRLDLAPQAAGLLAISLGLSLGYADDHEMLGHGIVMYDALYGWCRQGQGETHGWNPEALKPQP